MVSITNYNFGGKFYLVEYATKKTNVCEYKAQPIFTNKYGRKCSLYSDIFDTSHGSIKLLPVAYIVAYISGSVAE
jgi:hypothetical protein